MIDKLEEKIRAASENPDGRDAFYKALLDETLYIPVHTPDDTAVAIFSVPDQPDFTWAVADIQGVPTVPAFSSKAKLDDFLANVAESEGRWIATTGRKLLTNMTTSLVLHLEINPMSEYGVSLAPNMVRNILRMETAGEPI